MDYEASELEILETIISDASAEPIKLSYGLIRSITDNFSNEIGRGGFGVVYKAALRNGDVAVKKLSNPHALSEKQFLDEITCLQKTKHKNIVRFLGYCSESQGELLEFNGENIMADVLIKLLCFEYLPNGNIQDYLQQDKPNGDDWHIRYQMIRGICHGLHYLHEQKINHLDLKPENVMLDAHMEAKITDFGLSRCLDQGQSKLFTKHIIGTPRYIAPEFIDKGEISFKSDMYALGVLTIELLTGISRIGLDNWDESLDMDCPRMRRCAEIARSCMEHDKHNRPTIFEVISDLDDLDSVIPMSPTYEATRGTAFPGTDLVDVYPLRLNFYFRPNDRTHCHLSLTNKYTDRALYYKIIPEVQNKYQSVYPTSFLLPMRTAVITLQREAEEELNSDNTDNLELVVLTTVPDHDAWNLQVLACSERPDESFEVVCEKAQELFGYELHRTMLTAVSLLHPAPRHFLSLSHLISKYEGQEKEAHYRISSMDVHPTKPWVLLVLDGSSFIYLWNWETDLTVRRVTFKKEKKRRVHDKDYDGPNYSAKFIRWNDWIVLGDDAGCIYVHTCPQLDRVCNFKAQNGRGVPLLEVHPTRPFMLTYNTTSMKLWTWRPNSSFYCVGVFDSTGTVKRAKFSPKHTSTFTTLDVAGNFKLWKFDYPHSISSYNMVEGTTRYNYVHDFTYSGNRNTVAFSTNVCTAIMDFHTNNLVHTFEILQADIIATACHVTRPIFVTASVMGDIRVWDSTTYRLKKTLEILPKGGLHVGFTGSRRLVVGNSEGICLYDIDQQ